LADHIKQEAFVAGFAGILIELNKQELGILNRFFRQYEHAREHPVIFNFFIWRLGGRTTGIQALGYKNKHGGP
jgi:hypothetical protein